MKRTATKKRDLPWSEAAERNKEPILAALRDRMPSSGKVLEIGAGTGQHAVHLAQAFPALEWLATELPDHLPALAARLKVEGRDNLLPAQALDVLHGPWPEDRFIAAFSANTAHIMTWEAVEATIAGIGAVLVDGGMFFLYGPFTVEGRPTTPSNAAFDRTLRARDPAMGLRDVGEIETLARRHGMRLEEMLPMPANNFLLVLRREEEKHDEGH